MKLIRTVRHSFNTTGMANYRVQVAVPKNNYNNWIFLFIMNWLGTVGEKATSINFQSRNTQDDKEVNLKLQPVKSHFYRQTMEFLGHVLTSKAPHLIQTVWQLCRISYPMQYHWTQSIFGVSLPLPMFCCHICISTIYQLTGTERVE